MFSPHQLISYVFANPDDEYRGNDLLTLNLQQYLWKSLHRTYHTVYFLRSPDDRSFSVHTFGDRDAVLPRAPKWKQSPEDVFGKWLLTQLFLDPREAAAIVCPLDVFCRVFSGDAWAPILEKIASAPGRTGIFVLTAPVYSEDSQRYLLESPVFDRLKETAVTENRGRNQCIYTALRAEKPDHYRCLNAFTQDRIEALLLHICAADPGRCLDDLERQVYAKRLTALLQSGDPIPGVLPASQPAMYLTYEKLYRLLCDRTVWAQLTDPDVSFHRSDARTFPILRSPECYAGKCLKLQLPVWVQGQQDSCDRYPEDILLDIRKIVSVPSNCPENQKFVNAACGFLQKLRDLQEGDIDTCSLLLDGLKFCVQRITVCDSDANYQPIQDILELYAQYADISALLFQRDQNLTRQEADPFADSMVRLMLPQKRKELEKDKNDLNDCVGYLRASIVTMETSGISIGLRELLKKAMRKYDYPDNREDTDSFLSLKYC